MLTLPFNPHSHPKRALQLPHFKAKTIGTAGSCGVDGYTVTKPGLKPGQLPKALPHFPSAPLSPVSAKAGTGRTLRRTGPTLPPTASPVVLRKTFTRVHWLAFEHPFHPLLVGWGGGMHAQAVAWPRRWPRSHRKLVASPSRIGNHSSCRHQTTPEYRLPLNPSKTATVGHPDHSPPAPRLGHTAQGLFAAGTEAGTVNEYGFPTL